MGGLLPERVEVATSDIYPRQRGLTSSDRKLALNLSKVKHSMEATGSSVGSCFPNKQGSRPLLKAGGAPSELGTRTSHLTLSWTHTPSFPQPEDFDLLDWQVEGTELSSRTGVWHPWCLCFTWPMQKAAMQGSFLADSQLTTPPSYCPHPYLNLRTNISSIFKSKTLVLITQCTGVLENSAFRN